MTKKHEWTPRQAELLAKARERGPWKEGAIRRIRNADGCCPLEAALGLPPHSYNEVIDESGLDIGERVDVARAADDPLNTLRPALMAALGMPEAG